MPSPWTTRSSNSATSSTASATARRSSSTACRPRRARRSSRSSCSATRGHRDRALARARAEDPDRQVPPPHRLQAPQRLPRRDLARGDHARRRRCEARGREGSAAEGREDRRGLRSRPSRRPRRPTTKPHPKLEAPLASPPEGYEEMTIAQITEAAKDWSVIELDEAHHLRDRDEGSQGRPFRARVGAREARAGRGRAAGEPEAAEPAGRGRRSGGGIRWRIRKDSARRRTAATRTRSTSASRSSPARTSAPARSSCASAAPGSGPAPGTKMGRDDTIFAIRDGKAEFRKSGERRSVAVIDAE